MKIVLQQNILTLHEQVEGGEVVEPLSERALGRTLAEDLIDKVNNIKIASAGEIVSEEHLSLIENASLDSIKVRSVLTCESEYGVCAKCYGRDLRKRNPS